MIEINNIFSIGYRCNSVQFLRRFDMSKFSGPFDWMYIDLESALININNKFESYLNDIVIINKSENKFINLYGKNFDSVKEDITKLYNDDISYMNEDYVKTTLPINQNFNIVKTNDLYKWDRICVFLHHHLENNDEVEKIKTRVSRFNEVIQNDKTKVMLFYISKIIDGSDVRSEIDKICYLVKKYNIESNLVSIICIPNQDDEVIEIGNCFFIVKNVPDYSYQFDTYKTDNNFEWLEYGMEGINFEKEYDIIKDHYDLSNLLTKEEV
jgi:hypothetical protein